MDNYDEIMWDVLESEGLDKRFRENPEAVSQISDLLRKDVEKLTENSGRRDIELAVKKLLDNRDFIGSDGVRTQPSYTIEPDGSLTVKHETDVNRGESNVAKSDLEQTFSIGDKKEELVVTESRDYIDQTRDNTFASTSLKIDNFNRHGLQVQSRRISQNINLDTSIGIRTSSEAFRAIGTHKGYELSPVTETTLERGEDLATEYYTDQKFSNARILSFEKWGMIQDNKGKDAISNPIPLADRMGVRVEESKRGEMANFPPQYRPGHLMGYSEAQAKSYNERTPEEKAAAIRDVYEISAKESSSFRETLLEEARTNPNLQRVVAELGLTRDRDEKKVGMDDFKKAYEATTDKDRRGTMQSIKETSRETDKSKDSNGVEI